MENTPRRKRPNILMRIRMFSEEVWNKKSFEPHSSFLTLKSFWAPFLIIVVVFIGLCLKVVFEKNLQLDLFGWSVGDMYEWFKIPLWVLALLIPVLGLSNANHKSEQARAQMELTKAQNNFANYYKHIEEFTKFCRSLEKDLADGIEIKDRLLHKSLFVNLSSGDPHISESAASPIIKISETVSILIGQIEVHLTNLQSPGAQAELRKSISQQLIMPNSVLGKWIVCSKSLRDSWSLGQETQSILGEDISKLIMEVYIKLAVLQKAMEFDEKFDSAALSAVSDIISAISRLMIFRVLSVHNHG